MTKYNLPNNFNPYTWGLVIDKHIFYDINGYLYQRLVVQNNIGYTYVVTSFTYSDNNLTEHYVIVYLNGTLIAVFLDSELCNFTYLRLVKINNTYQYYVD